MAVGDRESPEEDILSHRLSLELPQAEIAVEVGCSTRTILHDLDRASKAVLLSRPLPAILNELALRAHQYPSGNRGGGVGPKRKSPICTNPKSLTFGLSLTVRRGRRLCVA